MVRPPGDIAGKTSWTLTNVQRSHCVYDRPGDNINLIKSQSFYDVVLSMHSPSHRSSIDYKSGPVQSSDEFRIRLNFMRLDVLEELLLICEDDMRDGMTG